jgi:putative ABC transport system permease protein
MMKACSAPVPSLAILALALLFMRLFPLFLRGLAWVTGRVLGGLAIVLALRQLARAPAVYSGALLLLVLTLSLATFSAAMARTLDRSLLDRELYRTGSDFLLSETGANTNWGNVADASASDGWVFVPVAEHLKVPGILAATRVGAYPVSVVSAGSGTQSATLYGIDRLDFPKAAFFRSDFSPESLGTLMNRLAAEPDAVLVSSNLLAEQQVGVGERVNVSIGVYGERRTLQFTIAGVINYFPTYYPADDNHYLLVGNLEYLFEQLGGPFPYDVWIKTSADLDPQTLQNDLFQHDINVVSIRGSQEAIAKERDRPERAGLFGMLSVGFVAATLLTVLGFLLHSLISFRRQSIEFGVLRAIGLTLWQMTTMLACEQFLLIVVGVGVGTGVGIWVSERFIPFLEVGTSALAQVPPFVVQNDWHDLLGLYALAAAMLAVAVGAMIGLLVRLRIFEMIKLGDAV